jgi:hypothetical protein
VVGDLSHRQNPGPPGGLYTSIAIRKVLTSW